jgi:cell fate regulator YaaT (PSP1 superfamily)
MRIMKTKRNVHKTKEKVNVSQSGGENVANVVFKSTEADLANEKHKAFLNVVEAQIELIRVLHDKSN